MHKYMDNEICYQKNGKDAAVEQKDEKINC
jgi:hypothetical protein